MPHVLEIKGGELLTPFNVFDVMDAVEDNKGTDIRQYLEEYLEGVESDAEKITDDENSLIVKKTPITLHLEAAKVPDLQDGYTVVFKYMPIRENSEYSMP